MLYKYSVILDFDPIINKYGEVRGRIDSIAREFGFVNSSLEELSNKEQLRYYISRNNIKDRDKMLKLVDKL